MLDFRLYLSYNGDKDLYLGGRFHSVPENLLHLQQDERFCFSEQGDEALVVLAKHGDSQAMEILVSRYRDYAKQCSGSYFLMGADREDVIQEGMIGLYKAILGFEAKKNVSFKTFARLCIKRQILSAVKMSTRQKHLPLNTYVSLDDGGGADIMEHISYTGETGGADPEQLLIEQENVLATQDRIDKALSEFEATVLMHHLDGEHYMQIATRLGREPKSVDNALQRIKHKVAKFLSQKQEAK